MDRVTVAISRETANRLKRLGRYGDTMETIIRHVLDEYEKMESEKTRILPKLILGGTIPLVMTALKGACITAIIL
jgi:hypothetical protein